MVPVEERAARHAALGDPIRLAMVDALAVSDLTPSELQERFGMSSNLLAHHLGFNATGGNLHQNHVGEYLIDRLEDSRRELVEMRLP